MTRPAAAGPETWSRYWAAGHEHSCPTSFTGFYGENTQAFWRRQAAGLMSDDVVLDLGCGNGALLCFLLAQFPDGAAPMLHGVDAAALRPAPSSSDRIAIHARTPFASLPLPSGAVTLATSQYGIEYGNRDDTWTELLRVLAPRARVAFIAHKKGSRLDAVAADELLICRAALAADGPLDAARAMVPFLERAATPEQRQALASDPRAEAARRQFNAASDAMLGMGRLVQNGDSVHDILGSVTQVLAQVASGTGPAAQRRLDLLGVGIQDHLARITALRDCALGQEGLEAVRARLTAAGFVLAGPATLSEQGFEMGWIIEGTRDTSN